MDAGLRRVLRDDTDNTIYELGGPSFTLADLAATITDVTGTKVRYRDLAPTDYTAALNAAGINPPASTFLAAVQETIARGELETDSTDLAQLLGRTPTSLADAVRAAYP